MIEAGALLKKWHLMAQSTGTVLGVSEKRYSLVKDFLEPGNHLTLATLKPEILTVIASNDTQKIAVNNK
jgi:hypothetical protein